jgi:hypothetical protein
MRSMKTNFLGKTLKIEEAWAGLEADLAVGTLIRVDEAHPSAFYATRDFDGRRGLLLITREPPLELPALRAVEIRITTDNAGHTQLFLWLNNPELASIFALLCDDLIESSTGCDPDHALQFVARRLLRWKRLFEAGKPEILSGSELRGFIGELAVLRESFAWLNPASAVLAWRGPLDAPQDFAFPGLLMEAKTTGPTSLRVRINSSDQLDAAAGTELALALVLLAAAASDAVGAFTAPSLIAELMESCRPFPGVCEELLSLLRAAGYTPHPDYAGQYFRVDEIRYSRVEGGFPRLVRSDLMPGIADASYDIHRSAMAPYEVGSCQVV